MRLIRRYAIAIVFALAAFIVAAALYRKLPAQVPVHWSASGAVDRSMAKSVGAFMQPISALVIVGLLMVVEPKNWRVPEAGAIHWIYPAMAAVLAGFMLYMTILMLLAATGTHLDMPTDVTVGIGILFAALGSNLGKVPPNRRVGIRLPWTRSNREVWRRTHRLAGWLFTFGGVVTAGFALIARSASSPIFGAAILVASAFSAGVYSFILSRRLPHDGAPGD